MLALDQATGLLTLKQPGSTPFHSNLHILRIQDVQASMVSLHWHGYALAAYVHVAMYTANTQPARALDGRTAAVLVGYMRMLPVNAVGISSSAGHEQQRQAAVH